jgi:hypothetical protein
LCWGEREREEGKKGAKGVGSPRGCSAVGVVSLGGSRRSFVRTAESKVDEEKERRASRIPGKSSLVRLSTDSKQRENLKVYKAVVQRL